MGAGGTGSNDDTVKPIFFYFICYALQGILGTGVESVLAKYYARQRTCIISDRFNIYNTGNICPAVTDKYTYPGGFRLKGLVLFRV